LAQLKAQLAVLACIIVALLKQCFELRPETLDFSAQLINLSLVWFELLVGVCHGRCVSEAKRGAVAARTSNAGTPLEARSALLISLA
jgi:hypothetical protein